MAGAGRPPLAGLLQPRALAHASQGKPEGHRAQALGYGIAPQDPKHGCHLPCQQSHSVRRNLSSNCPALSMSILASCSSTGLA